MNPNRAMTEKERGHRLAFVVGIVAIVVALGAGFYAVARWSNAQDASADRREALGTELANEACAPERPAEMVRHGAGWSHGSYWEVSCPDGSVQIVDAYPPEDTR